MEDITTNTSSPSQESNQSITLSHIDLSHLNETRKWSNFLSILGFIGVGFLVLFALFSGSIFSMFNGGQFGQFPDGIMFIYGAFYIIMAVVYFFPCYYLFKFSQHLSNALANSNEEEMSAALRNQKSLYKFFGITVIVFMSLYIGLALLAFIMADFIN